MAVGATGVGRIGSENMSAGSAAFTPTEKGRFSEKSLYKLRRSQLTRAWGSFYFFLALSTVADTA